MQTQQSGPVKTDTSRTSAASAAIYYEDATILRTAGKKRLGNRTPRTTAQRSNLPAIGWSATLGALTLYMQNLYSRQLPRESHKPAARQSDRTTRTRGAHKRRSNL
jgi:hypothetical protein